MDRIDAIARHLGREGSGTFKDCSRLTGSTQVTSSSEYRYTLDNPLLSDKERASYEENGFIVIKNLVAKEKLEKYRQRFVDICNGAKVPPELTVMKDIALAKSEEFKHLKGEKFVTKVQSFKDDEDLFHYCTLPEVLEYVECFTGPNIMAMHTMLINKPPDPGTKSSRHPMHQDLHYFPFRPADRIVCSWTAMEKVHRQNGCLVVIPGTHTGELQEHVYPDWEGGVNRQYFGVKNYSPDQERVWLEMEAGDTVFFHPLLLHGSGMNRTDGFRKAISCHYAASECHYIDVVGTSQAMIQDEVRETLSKKNIKLPKEFELKMAWQKKGRLVQGEKVTL